MLPRRVYEKFMVFWNRRAIIANEDFLEAKPKVPEDLFPILTLLNSSFGEFMIRSVGHIYGGGVCNLNPNDLKILPILDVGRLDAIGRKALAAAFDAFVKTGGANQTLLDTQVFKIAGEFLPGSNELYAALEELRGLSTTLKSS